MAKTRGTGLLMVWADIDPDYEAEYHRWYDEEHIAHLLSVPGFLSAGRSVAVDGQPKYLTLYEFENPQVSESEPWAKARDGNPWSNRIRAFMRHDIGSPGVYRRLYPK